MFFVVKIGFLVLFNVLSIKIRPFLLRGAKRTKIKAKTFALKFFSHPDYNRRSRNLTLSARKLVVADFTADREFHPAPKN